MQKRNAPPTGRINPQNGNQAQAAARSGSGKNPKKRNLILPILLIVMGCAVFLFAAWSAMTSPVLASILNMASAPQSQPAPRQSFAQVNIAKPASMAPVAAEPIVVAPVALPTATATQEPQPVIIDVPAVEEPTLEVAIVSSDSDVPLATQVVEQVTAVPEVTSPETTNQTGSVVAEIVADTPTPEYTAPTAVAAYVPGSGNGGEHWIDVNLSEQRVYAYEGDTVVNSFVVSTGTWQTPTVTGKFKVWIKVRSQAMTGPGYYLPNVPYVMYFYMDYGLHGTYWHNNFGTPMSHGCVNLTIPDSEWLYNFASVGTVVNVHY